MFVRLVDPGAEFCRLLYITTRFGGGPFAAVSGGERFILPHHLSSRVSQCSGKICFEVGDQSALKPDLAGGVSASTLVKLARPVFERLRIPMIPIPYIPTSIQHLGGATQSIKAFVTGTHPPSCKGQS